MDEVDAETISLPSIGVQGLFTSQSAEGLKVCHRARQRSLSYSGTSDEPYWSFIVMDAHPT